MVIIAIPKSRIDFLRLFLLSVFKLVYRLEESIDLYAEKQELNFRRPNEILIWAIFDESFQIVCPARQITYN